LSLFSNNPQTLFTALPIEELVEKNSSAYGHRLCGNRFCSDSTAEGVEDKTLASGAPTVATEGVVCV